LWWMQIKRVKMKLILSLVLLTFFLSHKLYALEGNTLRVCTSGDFFPFQNKTADGKYVGFDIDLMQAFATSIHAELKMVDMRWDGVIPALIAHKCDFIAGGMSITPVRQKIVAFSTPVLQNKIIILANKLVVKNAESLQQLDENKFTIAVKLGTSAAAHLAQTPLQNLIVLKFDDNASIINALLTGRADAIAQDRTLLLPVLNAHLDKLKMLKEAIAQEDIGIAARKEDKNLLTQFNEFLIEWKKTDTYKGYIKKYF